MNGNSREFDSFTGQSFNANQPPQPIEWFNSLLNKRFQYASFYSSALSLIFFYLTVAFYQTTIFHPLDSIWNLFYVLFFPTFWFSAICVTLLGFCLSWFFISKCFHPLYETNFNITKYQVVMASLGMFVSSLIIWFFALCASLSVVYSSWTTFTLFACTAFLTSYQTALDANFRWQCTNNGVFAQLHSVWRYILYKNGQDLARNVARGYMMATPLCVILPALRSTFFDLIFAFNTNISNFFLIFVLQVVVCLMFEVINIVTMQPINLPLIGHSSISQKRNQQQNLISAITSENDLLREFGFRALNELARNSRNSREIIFSLSEPGKKPRNWTNIYEVCTRITDVVRDMLQSSTSYVEPKLGVDRKNVARLGLNLRPVNTPTIRPLARKPFNQTDAFLDKTGSNGSFTERDLYNLSKSKQFLLQPPNLNPRKQIPAHKSNSILTGLNSIPGFSSIEHWISAFSPKFMRPNPSVSSYYLKLAEYCLDTLSVLAAYSIDEDKYGIVQQDLSSIISTFLRLELAIDLYIRSTSSNKAELSTRENLRSLEDVLEKALKQVYVPFRPYIDSLELDDSERKLLSVLTSDLY